MSWFMRHKKPKEALKVRKLKIPEGVWIKCDCCREVIYKTELERNLNVCPKCDHHKYISAKDRIAMLVDEGSFTEMDENISPVDVLHFRDTRKYTERLKSYSKKTGMKDSVVSGPADINGIRIQISVMEFAFMGGSLGSVAGEKITRCIERGVREKNPVIIISSSGGARMQEGILSLMQMAKTSSALADLSDARLPFISIMTNPTMGGVTASFAMLGDIIIAEKNALIGFAGPRVIEQTIKQKLPEGFQRAEFLEERGMVDIVIHRKDMKSTVGNILSLLVAKVS